MTEDLAVTLPWDDGTTEPFWDGAQRGVLRVQRCSSCGHHQHYPRPLCLACRSTSVTWVDATGRGTVYSCTEVHLQVLADLPPPYTVALVDLEENGVRMLGACTTPLAIGDRVSVSWVEREGLPPFPRWVRAGGAAG